MILKYVKNQKIISDYRKKHDTDLGIQTFNYINYL